MTPRLVNRPTWGTISHLQRRPVARESWWAMAPRQQFTARCWQEVPRMRGSSLALTISGVQRSEA